MIPGTVRRYACERWRLAAAGRAQIQSGRYVVCVCAVASDWCQTPRSRGRYNARRRLDDSEVDCDVPSALYAFLGRERWDWSELRPE
jgi:hypothetical protein